MTETLEACIAPFRREYYEAVSTGDRSSYTGRLDAGRVVDFSSANARRDASPASQEARWRPSLFRLVGPETMSRKNVEQPSLAQDGASETPLVSVVIPTFNRAHALRRAILSVRNQTYENIELIIVDDGSADETPAVLAELGQRGFRYLRHETNRGASAARNTGIDAATGTYIAFLDSDDEWLPNRLSAAVHRFRQSELAPLGIVSCGNIAIRANGRKTRWIPRRRGWISRDLLLQKQVGISNQLLVVDAQLLRTHQIRYDPNLKVREEWDFAFQICSRAQFDFVPDALVIIYHHAGERLWNPRRALEAGEYLHEKYQSQFAEFPRGHSRFHLRNALTGLASGEWHRGRAEVRQAVSAMPTDWQAYLWYLIAALPHGTRASRVHSALIKLLRRATFDIR